MNEQNPIDQVFNGTPQPVDDEVLQRMEAMEAQGAASIAANEVDPEQQGTPSQSPQAPSTDGAQQKQEQPQQNKEDPQAEFYHGDAPDDKEQYLPGQAGYDAGDFARSTAEGVAAVPVAALDAGVDLINLIPGVNFKKLPRFQSDLAQGFRDITSLVAPTIGLTALTGVGGKAFAGAKLASMGKKAADAD
jgi:hypothetical protein